MDFSAPRSVDYAATGAQRTAGHRFFDAGAGNSLVCQLRRRHHDRADRAPAGREARRLLAEARRLLLPQGRLVVTTPNYRSLWPLIESGVNLVSRVSYEQQHVNKYGRGRLAADLPRLATPRSTSARPSVSRLSPPCSAGSPRNGSTPSSAASARSVAATSWSRSPAMTAPRVGRVPTYNEASNVPMIYDGRARALAGRSWELVVVDEDLPDGTADAVRALGLSRDNLRCIQRVQERGLRRRPLGRQAAHGHVIVVMDGDLQHEPA